MVLQELGDKLTTALRRLQYTTVVNDEVLEEILKEICRALVEADVNVKVVSGLRKAVKDKVKLDEAAAGLNRRRMIQRAVMEELVKLVDSGTTPYQMKKGKPNVVMFVGLQGAGKTTTIAKFANYYQRKGWRTCMVCADTFRAGAFDQLKQNATKLRVPFYGSYTEADPVRIAEEGVAQFRQENYEVIIVDTSGRHKQEEALFEEMKEIQAAVRPDNVVFVMDATQGQAVFDQAKSFHDAVDVGAVVITKLDGHAKGGGALSAVAATKAPIIFLGTGEHFDDLDAFNARSFISRLLGMGDLKGLMDEMTSTMDQKKQQDIANRMMKGTFTLRDMYAQFEQVMKLGPLSKVMGMLPGLGQMMQSMGGGMDEEGTHRLKKNLYIMDSMTDDELDNKVDIEKSESRILRIAKGSGAEPAEVYMLLKQHKQMADMVKKMSKSGITKGGDKLMAQQMQRNPMQMMQNLAKSMDPRMLQQMGGAQNMMKMMQQMAQGGGGMPGGGGLPGMGPGGPDLGSLMNMMGGAGRGGGGGFPGFPF